MSKESLLKKEFKESDIQRARNLINKDFTAKTKIQSGYQHSKKEYTEGDVWTESGKTWTIKNGIKQNITKLDTAKKALRIAFCFPKFNGKMKHPISKKMYKIHGFCMNCTVEMEHNLKMAGLYKQYEKSMIKGNIKSFIDDIEEWVLATVDNKLSFVTEQGDVEDWQGMSSNSKRKILEDLKSYTTYIRKQL